MDKIKIDTRKIGRGKVDSVELAQDSDEGRTFVNTVMKLPKECSKTLSGCQPFQVVKKAGETNVSRTISLLVIRELKFS